MTNTLSGKKILILYTAHTLGHQRVAENIGWWLSQAGAEVVLREVLRSDPSPLVKRFLKVHVWVNEHAPWLWAFLYAWGFWVVMMPFRLMAANLQKGEIVKLLAQEKPDMVITTQTAPSAVISVLKRQKTFRGLWGIAFSDYHFHRAWVYPRADFYLPNIVEQMSSLRGLGVTDKNMFRIGLALPPLVSADGKDIRSLLAIPENAKVVLVGSGTLGVRLPGELYELLDVVRAKGVEIGLDVWVIVACGRSETLYQSVKEQGSSRPWLKSVGFHEPMAELYAACNLMLTKPGGLTIAETLQRDLPVFVTHYLPGQEKLNIEFLTAHNAIIPLYNRPVGEWGDLIVRELVRGDHRKYLVSHSDIKALVFPSELVSLGDYINQLFHRK